ncbi:15080_t:CDS:2, partial [Acaulospora colombiana]
TIVPENIPKNHMVDVGALSRNAAQASSSPPPTKPVAVAKVTSKSQQTRDTKKPQATTSKSTSKGKGPEVPPKEKKMTKKAMQALLKERAEREKKMSHKEYIETLPDKWPNREKEYSQFLSGAVILFAERMWEKRAALYKHGAELVTAYDADRVTHIVSAGASWETVKLINENIGIPIHTIPLRIKIVKWPWVSDCEARRGLVEPTMDRYIHHDRWMRDIQGGGDGSVSSVAVVPKRKRREMTPILDSEDEEKARRLSVFRYQYPQKRHKPEGGLKTRYGGLIPVGPSGAIRGTVSKTAIAPVSPPRAAIEIGSDEVRSHTACDELMLNATSKQEVEEEPGIQYEAFQCMQVPDGPRKDCPNQDVVEKLEELMAIHKGRVDEESKWKAFALMKAIGRIRKHPTRFESMQELVAIPGIGAKTAEKIMEVIKTQGLKRLNYERTGETAVVMDFQGIYGVVVSYEEAGLVEFVEET